MSWRARTCLAGALIMMTAGCVTFGEGGSASHLTMASARADPVLRADRTRLSRPHRAADHPRRAHSSAQRPAPAKTSRPGTRAYPLERVRPLLGVYERGAPRTYRPILRFGRLVRRRPGIVLFYSGIGERFRSAFAEEAYRHGAMPLDQINPVGVSLAKIAAGRYDAYLKSYADEVRAFGHKVIIGFAHEMNGSWYPWGWTHVSPHTWVRAWRRVVTVFRRQKADNVIWLWTISRVLSQGPVRAYWPGAAYVKWVGIDGYYTEHQDTFGNVFNHVMRVVHRFTHDPVLISECAIGQRACQARMIPNLISGVLRDGLRGLVWFDVDQHGGLTKQDWRLEGHPRAVAAFRRGVRHFL